jgi:ABC-2 type transport system ATP-binding protein
MNVIEASGLGKRYGSTWALRECAVAIPAGHVAALVGVAFVAQDTPLYKNMSAAGLLHLTRNLNRRFDQRYAEARLGELGITVKRRAGQLSGGQQAQLALTLALARRPRLLVLDEPMAMLDPVARHDFMATVLTAAADHGMSVVLSSHVLAELERVSDYLILMSQGRVQVAGEVDDLLASHPNLPGSAWGVNQWYTKGREFAFPARGSQLVRAVSQLCPPRIGASNGSPAQCLSQHGYTQWTSYQPGSRFWPFQWIEGGWLLALSVLLIAATVWLVRHRVA